MGRNDSAQSLGIVPSGVTNHSTPLLKRGFSSKDSSTKDSKDSYSTAKESSSRLKISAPTNFTNVAHVDSSLNWIIPQGKDITSVLDVQETLGAGAFGTVYKVSLKASGFVMAAKQIKIIDESIKREVDTLKSCKHENLLQYYGCMVSSETWVLTDFCAAGSCTDIMERTQCTFSEVQASYILNYATRGLNYLHSQGVIHRDIKGANIMLTANGSVKLGDFGVSERITISVSKRQTTVGSPYWMAPEVIKGDSYGVEADIWSLGITAMELVDGVPPLSDIHPMRVLFKIPYLPPPQAEGSEKFKQFVSRCLQKDVTKRLNCRELLKESFLYPTENSRLAVLQKVTESLKISQIEKEKKLQEIRTRRDTVKKNNKRKASADQTMVAPRPSGPSTLSLSANGTTKRRVSAPVTGTSFGGTFIDRSQDENQTVVFNSQTFIENDEEEENDFGTFIQKSTVNNKPAGNKGGYGGLRTISEGGENDDEEAADEYLSNETMVIKETIRANSNEFSTVVIKSDTLKGKQIGNKLRTFRNTMATVKVNAENGAPNKFIRPISEQPGPLGFVLTVVGAGITGLETAFSVTKGALNMVNDFMATDAYRTVRKAVGETIGWTLYNGRRQVKKHPYIAVQATVVTLAILRFLLF